MLKIELYQADTGGFVIVTPQKCLQAATLEAALSEVRSAFRNKEGGQQEPCPYCGSTNTIGHGLRETGKQVLTRRFCKTCNKTWVSGREQKIVASTKEQVAFLKLLEYSETDITELVHKSKSTVRAHVENIEIAKYREKKQAEAAGQISKGKADGDKENGADKDGLAITPLGGKSSSILIQEAIPHCSRSAGLHDEPEPFGSILAPEFDRAQVLKERIGAFTVWDYNGRLAASEKGKQEVVYLTKTSILHMKMLRKDRQGKQKLGKYLQQVPEEQKEVIGELIETLIDEDLGMFPMLRVETRPSDCGEINAEVHEEEGYIITGGGGE